MKTKKCVLIIGASSGIGRSLAFEFYKAGWKVGITGRREDLLKEMQQQASEMQFSVFDITQPESSNALFLFAETMGSIDMIIVNAGIGNHNPQWKIEADLKTIETNVTGFTRMSMAAIQIFLKQDFGHLVGISSVAGHFGYGNAAAYNASKAFVSRYLSGLRHRLKRHSDKIFVTDCQPGFIETPLIAGKKEPFGVISSEKFAHLFVKAIEKKPRTLILPKRWTLAVWVLKLIPEWLIQKVT